MTRRESIAEILKTVAAEGLPGPRDLDVALDAIFAEFHDDKLLLRDLWEWNLLMGGWVAPCWDRLEERLKDEED